MIDIGRYIARTPGVVGGRPRIEGTRTPIETIVAWYKRGHSAEEIADQYEQLSLPQVYAALTYYHANQAEIEAEIAADEAEYERLATSHATSQRSA